MSTLTVLALDPGGTTGWAMYRATKMLDYAGQAEYYDEQWQFGTLGPQDHHSDLEALLELSRTDIYHVVTESFEFRQGTANRRGLDLSSKEYIGVTKAWGARNKVTVQEQTAALAKGFVTDKKLKAMALWSVSKHSRDATRHAVFYCVNRLGMTHLIDTWENM